MTAPCAVIGIGNTLRRDDGVGAKVIDCLRARVDPDRVELFTCHQLLPEVVESLRGRAGVIFVDASVELDAGEVRCDDVVVDPAPWRWGHHLEPASLLGIMDPVERPAARTIAIGAVDFEFGEELSTDVDHAVPAAVDCILSTVEEWTA